MTRICAWCKKILGIVEGGNPGDITHGICEECVAIEYAKLGILPAQDMEGINATGVYQHCEHCEIQ